MEPPGSLQKQIDRCNTGKHFVKVEIEALFYDLCCDQNGFWPYSVIFTKYGQARMFDGISFRRDEACVKKH
jgi:hypothetical protein